MFGIKKPETNTEAVDEPGEGDVASGQNTLNVSKPPVRVTFLNLMRTKSLSPGTGPV